MNRLTDLLLDPDVVEKLHADDERLKVWKMELKDLDSSLEENPDDASKST